MNEEALAGVEQTLLLPLWGRYSESKKPHGLLKDDKCVEVVDRLQLDFTALERQQHPLTRLAWITRAWNTDRELSRCMEGTPEVTVVCLGCGLETAFYRSPHSRMHWYDLDLPNVMELRKRALGSHESVTMLSGSVLEQSSFAPIRVQGKLIVLALGLLCYFTEAEVKTVFGNIASLAEESVLILDYFSELGVAVSNQLVLQNNRESPMIWHADGTEELAALYPGIQVLDTYPMFQNIRPLLSETEAAMAARSDQQNINSIALLKFKSTF